MLAFWGAVFNYTVIWPVLFVVRCLLFALAYILRVMYFKDSHRRRLHSTATTSSNALMNDPISDVEHFVRALEENLPPLPPYPGSATQLPNFYLGSFTQALYMATNRAKFLFVYLTNSHNESLLLVFSRIVTNPRFVTLTQAPNTLIWGGDLVNLEAYQLANDLNVTKFPFLGLMCLTRSINMTPQGPSKTAPKVSLVLKIQGGIGNAQDAEQVIQHKFVRRILKYEPELAIMRAELREQFENEMLKLRQSYDYEQLLAADRRKKEARRLAELVEGYLRWRQPYFLALKNDQENKQDKAKVAIRMASGSRVTMHFPKNSPVEDVFIFVELMQRNLLEDPIDEEEEHEEYSNFFMEHKFTLMTPVAPQQLLSDIDPATEVQNVLYIYPSGLLVVEAVE